MTVRMLLNSIDSHELTEWIAFAKIEMEEPEEDKDQALKNQLLTMPTMVNQRTKHELMMRKKEGKV